MFISLSVFQTFLDSFIRRCTTISFSVSARTREGFCRCIVGHVDLFASDTSSLFGNATFSYCLIEFFKFISMILWLKNLKSMQEN